MPPSWTFSISPPSGAPRSPRSPSNIWWCRDFVRARAFARALAGFSAHRGYRPVAGRFDALRARLWPAHRGDRGRGAEPDVFREIRTSHSRRCNHDDGARQLRCQGRPHPRRQPDEAGDGAALPQRVLGRRGRAAAASARPRRHRGRGRRGAAGRGHARGISSHRALLSRPQALRRPDVATSCSIGWRATPRRGAKPCAIACRRRRSGSCQSAGAHHDRPRPVARHLLRALARRSWERCRSGIGASPPSCRPRFPSAIAALPFAARRAFATAWASARPTTARGIFFSAAARAQFPRVRGGGSRAASDNVVHRLAASSAVWLSAAPFCASSTARTPMVSGSSRIPISARSFSRC